jgi:hypothetical protein
MKSAKMAGGGGTDDGERLLPVCTVLTVCHHVQAVGLPSPGRLSLSIPH